jgi:hypothetical protein
MSWVIKSTDTPYLDELAIIEWQKDNPSKVIIGRDEYGIWWDDPPGHTFLTKWNEIREYLK